MNIAGSTMKSSKHKSNSVISKTKSALLEASPVFDGLTFKNNEGDIIDVKKTLAKNTRSAIDFLSHEANLRNTNDPVFNKLAGRKKSKPRKTLQSHRFTALQQSCLVGVKGYARGLAFIVFRLFRSTV